LKSCSDREEAGEGEVLPSSKKTGYNTKNLGNNMGKKTGYL
jgi:hypothetical protein